MSGSVLVEHIIDPPEMGEQRTNAEGRMLCNDCSQPLFYCTVEGWYFHMDPDAAPCFLSDSSHPFNGLMEERIQAVLADLRKKFQPVCPRCGCSNTPGGHAAGCQDGQYRWGNIRPIQ